MRVVSLIKIPIKFRGGLHGVGVSVVNALSDWLKLKVYRDKKIHEAQFKQGVIVEPLKILGDTEKTGTEVTFMPSADTFENIDFHFDLLAKRIRELSFLNNGVNIDLIDHRSGKNRKFCIFRRYKGFCTVYESI